MADHYFMEWPLRLLEGAHVMGNTTKPWAWICPRCGVEQPLSEIRTLEIEEPGRGTRVEFYGKIRPCGSEDGPMAFSCLVCGHVWENPENPTPGGASITFLHPITECDESCLDRDAC